MAPIASRTFMTALVLAFLSAATAVPTSTSSETLNKATFEQGQCDHLRSSSSPPEEGLRAVVNKGERDFSVRLIKNLFEGANATGTDGNVFVSPSSIYQVLMMAYFGSAGITERELADLMGFNNKSIDTSKGTSIGKDAVRNVYVFERAFQAIREKSPDLGYKLIHANKLYFDRSLRLDDCLFQLLGDELSAVDFAHSPDKARKEVNEWVEDKTLDKIKNLLPAGSVDASTQVALVNAAYFKGQWKSQFKRSKTKRDNFYISRDKISVAKFMTRKGQYNYYLSEELRAHVLQMPYVGDSLSMIIILPPFEDGALKKTVRRMTPERIQGVVAEVKSGFYKIDDLTIQIPRFRIEQSMDLASVLGELGARTLFDTANSNLSNFLSSNSHDRVTLQSAIHKSYIEVNEEGSEAAGSTALFGFRSARPLFYKEFIANHPFMFLIYDEETDIILFFGVMQDPNA